VYVKNAGCRRCKVTHWSDCLAGDFGALAELLSTCQGGNPSARLATQTLCVQLRRCFGAWMPKVMDGLEHLEP
jgi:hypothetical protein